jgi:Tol biopolymer transport system component
MSDVDERIRELLQDRAGDIATYRPTPPNLQGRARRRIALVVGSAALGVALLAFGAFAGVRELAGAREQTPAHRAPTTPTVGTLAFIGRDGLVVATTDGAKSDVVREGVYSGFEDYQWSPDGTRIAVISGAPGGKFTGGAMGVAVMKADGSAVQQLASCAGRPGGQDKGFCDGLSWSPDGERLVFSGERSLFVVDLDTGSVRQITGCDSCDYTGAALNPAWSPKGSRIAFADLDSVDVVDADGSGWRRLAAAPDPGDTGRPEWSPDGARIVFGATDGVYVVDEDGSNLDHLLVQGPEETPNAPTWSPDGTRIAYISTPKAVGIHAFVEEVWVIKADGTERARLYESSCCINGWGGPAWSPDGRSIAFGVWVGTPDPAVYVMGADGSGLHAVPGFGFGDPVWQPTPGG